MIPEWTNRYIEIPFSERGRGFDGVDCWGLVRLVLKERYNIDVPGYNAEYISTNDGDTINELIEKERRAWWDVGIDEAQPGDVVLFAVAGKLWHVGIVVGDRCMLNARKGAGVILEKYNGSRWKRRLRCIYRHYKLMNWQCTPYPWPLEEKINHACQ